MAAICPRWGCLKKRDGWRWEGSLKKPDVIRSPRNKTQKNWEVPVRLGFLGLPIDRPKGPRRNFLAWSSGSKVFPGSCLMLLNVIKSMGCSRELTGKKLEGQQERLHCQHIHMHAQV